MAGRKSKPDDKIGKRVAEVMASSRTPKKVEAKAEEAPQQPSMEDRWARIKFYVDPELYPIKISQMTPYFEPSSLDYENAGFDLRACAVLEGTISGNRLLTTSMLANIEGFTFVPGYQYTINTGVKMEIPAGHVGLLTLRSSMKQRGFVCSPGLIDSNYRGFIYHTVQFTGLPVLRDEPGKQARTPLHVGIFERISQITILPYFKDFSVVNSFEELSSTNRGEKGHGQYTGNR